MACGAGRIARRHAIPSWSGNRSTRRSRTACRRRSSAASGAIASTARRRHCPHRDGVWVSPAGSSLASTAAHASSLRGAVCSARMRNLARLNRPAPSAARAIGSRAVAVRARCTRSVAAGREIRSAGPISATVSSTASSPLAARSDTRSQPGARRCSSAMTAICSAWAAAIRASAARIRSTRAPSPTLRSSNMCSIIPLDRMRRKPRAGPRPPCGQRPAPRRVNHAAAYDQGPGAAPATVGCRRRAAGRTLLP